MCMYMYHTYLIYMYILCIIYVYIYVCVCFLLVIRKKGGAYEVKQHTLFPWTTSRDIVFSSHVHMCARHCETCFHMGGGGAVPLHAMLCNMLGSSLYIPLHCCMQIR